MEAGMERLIYFCIVGISIREYWTLPLVLEIICGKKEDACATIDQPM
jgi:hypothetical protein